MFLDENIYWKDHIHNAENKIAKNIRFLFHARNLENISQKHISIPVSIMLIMLG